jgi:hypothetical protein
MGTVKTTQSEVDHAVPQRAPVVRRKADPVALPGGSPADGGRRG